MSRSLPSNWRGRPNSVIDRAERRRGVPTGSGVLQRAGRFPGWHGIFRTMDGGEGGAWMSSSLASCSDLELAGAGRSDQAQVLSGGGVQIT